MQDVIYDPRTVASSKDCYEAMNWSNEKKRKKKIATFEVALNLRYKELTNCRLMFIQKTVH